jgi:hypothetical protein
MVENIGKFLEGCRRGLLSISKERGSRGDRMSLWEKESKRIQGCVIEATKMARVFCLVAKILRAAWEPAM